MLSQVRGGLIVSCQALPNEPLHSSFIMGRMARAAAEGGAVGIRANTPEDIAEIAKNTTLPIIGIVKRDYPDSPIYITPTLREIRELAPAASAGRIAGSILSSRPSRGSRQAVDGRYRHAGRSRSRRANGI